MKQFTKLILGLAVGTASWLPSQAQEKIILLNEGNWQADNGRITYFENGEIVSNQWFRDVNGYKLGDTPNDIIQVRPNLIAIAINWSNIIQFIDAEGNAIAATEDVPNNRKLATDPEGRYVYVSSYGHECMANGGMVEFEKGFVAKIDTETFQVVETVEVGWEPEGIAYYDGKLFVANTGGYAFQEDHEYETTVSVIDAETMEVEREVDTGQINLYGKMSQSGQYLCINSPGDYYTVPAAAIILDCEAVAGGKPDEECFRKLGYAATYSTVMPDGKFLAIGSMFSYISYSYEFNYITIDPAEVMGSGGEKGIGTTLPGTMLSDLEKMTQPYGVYVNPYTGYMYATDAFGFTEGGDLLQWTPEGELTGRWSVYINPGHFLALNPAGENGDETRHAIRISCPTPGAEFTLLCGTRTLRPDSQGVYYGGPGVYTVTGGAPGYRCFHGEFTIPEDAEGDQLFEVELTPADEDVWDGKSVVKPATEGSTLIIDSPAKLAWVADQVKNGKNRAVSLRLTADIDLGDYPWTPIGADLSNSFQGQVEGAGHKVTGLYVYEPRQSMTGLFGYVYGKNAYIRDLEVDGSVTGSERVGGIVGMVKYGRIDRCVNHADVTALKERAGGIAGYVEFSEAEITDCINTGRVTGPESVGGIAGRLYAGTVAGVLNTGIVAADVSGACVGQVTNGGKVNDAYSSIRGTYDDGSVVVAPDELSSGEVAWLLGDSFGQVIGSEDKPVIGGERVYQVKYTLPGDARSSTGEESVLYTNSRLPDYVGGVHVVWYSDPEKLHRIDTIDSDMTLYVSTGSHTGIDGVGIDGSEAAVRWYRPDGVEVKAPTPGTHGVFIRVSRGRAVKVML